MIKKPAVNLERLLALLNQKVKVKNAAARILNRTA
jgi:hypothetical protein